MYRISSLTPNRRFTMKIVRFVILVVVLLGFMSNLHALTIRTGDDVEVPLDEVIDDDLIIFGSSVTIDGTVLGDIFTFAQDVKIHGDVGGTIIAGAERFIIESDNVRTVWAAGRTVKILGAVERNLITAAGYVVVDENAAIGKDARIFAGELLMEGHIKGNLKGAVGEFTMTGSSGTINMNVDNARITSTARVNGDLILEIEEAEPEIEEGAVISGDMKIDVESDEKEEEYAFLFAPIIAFFYGIFKLICFIAKIIVGVVLVALFSTFVRTMMDTLKKKPWWSLLVGFLTVIIVPIAVIILFFLLVGWPFAVFGIYAYTVLFYLASIFVSLVLGELVIRLFKKDGEISLYLSFIVGLVIITILGLIPILGFVVNLFVLLFGVGMLVIGMWDFTHTLKKKKLI
jgi:cytoskeletal protein CcmA (bactofilin family)